jgi:hypothetical protein
VNLKLEFSTRQHHNSHKDGERRTNSHRQWHPCKQRSSCCKYKRQTLDVCLSLANSRLRWQPTGLTDKLGEIQSSGDIARWDGKANPVPPQVEREYWIRVYNRADTLLYTKAKDEVKKEAADHKFVMSAAAITGAVKRRQEISRDIDETWDMALQLMIRDIISADEELHRRASDKTKNKRLALRRTREL